MTDEQDTSSDAMSADEQQVDEPIESTKKPKASAKVKTSGTQGTKAKRSWLALLSILISLSIAGAAFWFGSQGYQQLQAQKKQIELLQNSLSAVQGSQQSDVKALRQSQSQLDNKLGQNARSTQTQFTNLDQRLTAQGKRLRAMSDTSRDDWLLAEAQYLLKLANQRIRIERSADGAEALLEEADGILRDLDDPSLHSLRAAIAKDLAALRLMQKIDVEGIYLTLVALTDQVEVLPVHPQKFKEPKLSELSLEEERDPSLQDRANTRFSEFLNSLKDYYRVRKLDAPAPVLEAGEAMYLQQNLRLILERAQLALLREQQEIYSQSLVQADTWIKKYFPESGEKIRFRQSLAELSDKHILQDLPDISRSLNLLHEYIEQLHDLKGVKVTAQNTTKVEN